MGTPASEETVKEYAEGADAAPATEATETQAAPLTEETPAPADTQELAEETKTEGESNG